MPRAERDTLLIRINEIQQTLEHTRSDDVRDVLQQTLTDCIIRLAELNEIVGDEPA